MRGSSCEWRILETFIGQLHQRAIYVHPVNFEILNFLACALFTPCPCPSLAVRPFFRNFTISFLSRISQEHSLLLLSKMGQEYSTDDSESGPSHIPEKIDANQSDIDYEALSGYRVMKVFSGSPASRSGLAPFEDFIIAVNGSVVHSDTSTLSNVLREHEGKELALVVWNCVDSKARNVGLTPVQWNGPGLLGAAVRYEALRGCADHVQRVMDVLPNSPADEAGLAPKTDYIVGTRSEVFRGENDFNKLVRCTTPMT